ncbi:MAG TPA: hypothetical protein VHZ98_04735 [Galbitalea sp.]|jgi:hypothetical protein|nr:hypothetical protein [Galbitalea sp.]
MPTHLPDSQLQYAPDVPVRDSILSLAPPDGLRTIDIDWDILKRDLNDRISMVVEYGYWKSSADVSEDDLPHDQVKTVDKILALCRVEPILYVTGSIRPGGAGALVALTSRLVVSADLSPVEKPDTAGSFTSRVRAQSRRDISGVELLEVSEARHDANWPTRIRINLTVGGSEIPLPLAKGHQVTKEENLAALLPALLEDLDRR